MFGDWKRDCTLRTLVDSALPGSQALASFFSAPMSLLDSGKARTRMTSQKPTTTHLVQLPAGISAILLRLLIDSLRCRRRSGALALAFIPTLTAASPPVIRGFPDMDTDFQELPANTGLSVLGARRSAASAWVRRGGGPKGRRPGGNLGPRAAA